MVWVVGLLFGLVWFDLMWVDLTWLESTWLDLIWFDLNWVKVIKPIFLSKVSLGCHFQILLERCEVKYIFMTVTCFAILCHTLPYFAMPACFLNSAKKVWLFSLFRKNHKINSKIDDNPHSKDKSSQSSTHETQTPLKLDHNYDDVSSSQFNLQHRIAPHSTIPHRIR